MSEPRVPTCGHCKTKANRPLVERHTVKRKGREYIEDEQVYKTFSCACQRCEYSGDLAAKFIDKDHPVILNPKSTGDTNDEVQAETE